MSGRTVLTQEAMAAAIAAGADPATLELEALTEEQKVAAEAAAETARVAAEAKTAAEAEAAKVAAEAAAGSDAAQPDAKDGKIEILASQLAEASEKLVGLKVELQLAKDKVESNAGTLEALKKIAADSINKMTVALGGSVATLESFTNEQIVARHTEVSAQFLSKFKVGGVAISGVEGEVETKKPASNVTSLQKARVNSAKIGSK